VVRRLVVGENVIEAFLDPRDLRFGREREDEIDEHGAEVRPVSTEHGGALALAEQECQDGHVRLGSVAIHACEDEVVAPIVRALASPGRDMVQGDRGGGDATTAVGANGAVLLKQPALRFCVCGPAGRGRRELGGSASAPRTSGGTFSGCLHNVRKIAAGPRPL
jgi:hypothetical protein